MMSETRTYVKKPIPITAEQLDQDTQVKTLEGTMHGKKGDYLVTGVYGEKYVVNKSVFEDTYELVRIGKS